MEARARRTGGPSQKTREYRERWSSLELLERWLERPMFFLGLAWLVLLIIELVRGIDPLLETAMTVIWVVFVVDFGLRLALAPRRFRYLRRHWLTALSLLVPAFRMFRVVRAFPILRAGRAVRGLRLFRVLAAMNRGMGALGAAMSRRGVGYVAGLTLLVALGGAAGIHALERDVPDPRSFQADFGSALWWTAMLLTTMGVDTWPATPEGKLLTLVLSIYAFGVFGYLTAALASYFVGRDAEREDAEIAGKRALRELRREISRLRADLRANRPGAPEGDARAEPTETAGPDEPRR